MNCPRCGRPLSPAMKFCRSCGAAVEKTDVGGETPESLAEASTPSAARLQPQAPTAPRQPPPAPLAQPASGDGKGPLFALAAIAICVLVAGLVGAGAYLLTREDSDTVGTTSLPPIEPGDAVGGGSLGEGDRREASSSGSSPTERGFPTDSEPAMRAEVEELLREFHVAFVERDFQYAWTLLTSRKRRQAEQEGGFPGWKEDLSTLTPYLVPDGIHVEIDELEDDRVARVLVTGMAWTEPGSPCSEWSGLTWVRYEGGAWRRDPGYSTTAERRRDWEDRSGELLGVGC